MSQLPEVLAQNRELCKNVKFSAWEYRGLAEPWAPKVPLFQNPAFKLNFRREKFFIPPTLPQNFFKPRRPRCCRSMTSADLAALSPDGRPDSTEALRSV